MNPIMSEKVERLKRAIKVGLLTGQTHIDHIWLRARANRASIIVFLGDSRAKAWPSPSTVPQYIFRNCGVGFDTSRQVLERLSIHVAPIQPQVVLVQAGINNCKELLLAPPNHAIIVQETLTTLLQIADEVRAADSHVLLSTIFPVSNVTSLHSSAFWGADQPDAAHQVRSAVEQINRGLASLNAADVTIFDAAAILQNADGWLDPIYARDELHLNEAGYQRLNQSLGPVLLKIVG